MKNVHCLSLSLWVLLLASALLISTQTSAAEPQVKLSFTMPENDGALITYVTEVFAELSRRSGIDCAIEVLPKKRALVAANHGHYDGVGTRVKGLQSKYPNLNRIKVSLIKVKHVIFAQRPDIINGVSDQKSLLKHAMANHYRVGHLLGSKKAADELAGLPNSHKVQLTSPAKAFELITENRLGAYIGGPAMVNKAILKNNFKNTAIKEVAVLSEFDLYPYVHKKHAEHIPLLEQTLQSMASDGTLVAIRKRLE